MYGMTKGLMKSTEDSWREIGTNGRKKEGSIRKKRKKKMRKEEQRNGMKKMRQEKWEIYTTSYRKFSEQKSLREGYCHESPRP